MSAPQLHDWGFVFPLLSIISVIFSKMPFYPLMNSSSHPLVFRWIGCAFGSLLGFTFFPPKSSCISFFQFQFSFFPPNLPSPSQNSFFPACDVEAVPIFYFHLLAFLSAVPAPVDCQALFFSITLLCRLLRESHPDMALTLRPFV